MPYPVCVVKNIWSSCKKPFSWDQASAPAGIPADRPELFRREFSWAAEAASEAISSHQGIFYFTTPRQIVSIRNPNTPFPRDGDG
jgi:hypothetical protein